MRMHPKFGCLIHSLGQGKGRTAVSRSGLIPMEVMMWKIIKSDNVKLWLLLKTPRIVSVTSNVQKSMELMRCFKKDIATPIKFFYYKQQEKF